MQENLVLCQGEKHNISLACRVIGCGSITLGTIIAPPLYQISRWKASSKEHLLKSQLSNEQKLGKNYCEAHYSWIFWSVCIKHPSPSPPPPPFAHRTSWSKDPIIKSMVRSTDPRHSFLVEEIWDFPVALFSPPNSIKVKHGSLFIPKIHELLAVNLFFEGSLASNFWSCHA